MCSPTTPGLDAAASAHALHEPPNQRQPHAATLNFITRLERCEHFKDRFTILLWHSRAVVNDRKPIPRAVGSDRHTYATARTIVVLNGIANKIVKDLLYGHSEDDCLLQGRIRMDGKAGWYVSSRGNFGE